MTPATAALAVLVDLKAAMDRQRASAGIDPLPRRLARLEALATSLGAIPPRVCANCRRPRRRAGRLCLRCALASPSGRRRERERKRRERAAAAKANS